MPADSSGRLATTDDICPGERLPARTSSDLSRHPIRAWGSRGRGFCRGPPSALDDSDRLQISSGYAKRRTGVAALLLNPERECSLTDLARRFDAPLSTVHYEVKRLTEAGLLRRRSAGRSTMVQANSGNRLVGPLAELLFLSWGPMQVVADEFAELDGAERVLIFGSWAARYLQWPGTPPHDLDVRSEEH